MSGYSSGMSFNSGNILKLTSILSPIIVVFFIVMSSIFNENIKGLVYLAGILIVFMINMFLMNQIKSDAVVKPEQFCSIIDFPIFNSPYDTPAPTSVTLAFTAAYLIIPMILNSQINYFVLAFFLFIFGVDSFYKVTEECTKTSGVLLGGLVGIMFAIFWFFVLHINGFDSLLFFNDFQSNRMFCSKPNKQTFKCSVYKNGKLISSNVA